MKLESYHNTILYNINISDVANKIIAFDLDDTLITTKSGNKFPKNYMDYKYLYNNTSNILKELYKDYTIIIFSNQKFKNIDEKTKELEKKFTLIENELNIKLDVMISTNDDKYRKPFPCMWEVYMNIKEINFSAFENIIYIGDAAGRENDFSCSDRKFAFNCGMIFKTPEEYFKNEDPKPWSWGFDPQKVLDNIHEIKVREETDKEMVILVGFPGCGKSTFVKNYFPKYYSINQDTLKTKSKCIKICKEKVKTNSIIIDNTNASSDYRKIFIDIAK